MDKTNDQADVQPKEDEQEQVDSTEETLEEESSEQDEKSSDSTKRIEELENQIADLTGKLKRATKKPKKESNMNTDTTEEFGLLHKSYLAAVGIRETDEVELAREIQERTGMDWDKLPQDDYFQHRLEALRTEKANAKAVDTGAGGGTTSNAKLDPSYWAQKGALPTPDDIPSRSERVKIINALKDRERNSGGKFYNDKK